MTIEEMMMKAKKAKSAEELFAMANENGVAITEEEAQMYFAQLHHSGDLSDDELDNVTGGCGGDKSNKEEKKKAPANTSENKTIVNSTTKCFMDRFEKSISNKGLPLGNDEVCGKCKHMFALTSNGGYCTVSKNTMQNENF